MSASLARMVGVCDRTGRCADWLAQVRARQVLKNLLKGDEEEGVVVLDRAADVAAELFAVKVRQRLAVGGVGGQGFQPLEVEKASVKFVGARLGDDVDDAARRAPELGGRARRDDLKLLDGVERDIYGGALASGLLAEEAVVVVAAVEADVVEDAALPCEVDLVAVRPLHDRDVWRQGQEVFKFPAEHGQIAHSLFVQSRARFRFDRVNGRERRNRHDLVRGLKPSSQIK